MYQGFMEQNDEVIIVEDSIDNKAFRRANVNNIEEKDLMIITSSGIVIRISINQISELSRNTQGVRLINLKNDQKVATANTIEHLEEETISLDNNDINEEQGE